MHIGPVTLRPRFNDAVDERQTTEELAAWTVASAAALVVPGVASLTYFEEWGPRGIRSSSGEPFPPAHALRAVHALTGGRLLAGDSPDGLVWAIGSQVGDATGPDRITTVLVANIDHRERALTIETAGGAASVVLPPLSWTELTPD